MKRFATKLELIKAFANTSVDYHTGIIEGEMAARYVPQYYRGGWIIPRFGYSTERIGVQVSEQEAGNPNLIEAHGSVV